MTYNPDYDRKRDPISGLGDYPETYNTNPKSGKWLLIAIAILFTGFAALAFYAGETTAVVNDGEISKPLSSGETTQPAPIAPATD